MALVGEDADHNEPFKPWANGKVQDVEELLGTSSTFDWSTLELRKTTSSGSIIALAKHAVSGSFHVVTLLPVEIVVPDEDDSNPPLLAGTPSDIPVADGVAPLVAAAASAAAGADPDPEFVTQQFKAATELKVVKFEDSVVFYVYAVRKSGSTVEASGIARHSAAAAYTNNAYVTYHRHKPYTLVHELVHLFTKRGHYAGVESGDYPPDGPLIQHKVDHNLMKNGTDAGTRIETSKRLYRAQQSTIYKVLSIP